MRQRHNTRGRKAILDQIGKPGVNYVLVKHDRGCPGSWGEADKCCCSPEIELTTEPNFIAAVHQTRAQRRKAQREAAKAVARAARKGGK